MKRVTVSLILVLLAGSSCELFAGKTKKNARKKAAHNNQETLFVPETISVSGLSIDTSQLSQQPKEVLTTAYIGLYAQMMKARPPLRHIELIFDELVKKNNKDEEKTKAELCGYAATVRNEISAFREFLNYNNDIEKITNPTLVSTGYLTPKTSHWKYHVYETMKAKTPAIKYCTNKIAELEKELEKLKAESQNYVAKEGETETAEQEKKSQEFAAKIESVSTQISLYQGAKECHARGLASLEKQSRKLITLLQEEHKVCQAEIRLCNRHVGKINRLLSDLRKKDAASDSFEEEKKNYEAKINKRNLKAAVAKEKMENVAIAIKHINDYLGKVRQPASYARTFGLV